MSVQYTHLYKKNKAFYIETIAIIPASYKNALPVITDYSTYNDWALDDVNIKRNGAKGKYFFDISSLKYFTEKEKIFFELNIAMNKLSKEKFGLKLQILDSTNISNAVPSFSLKMNDATKLSKNVEGVFSFVILEGVPYFVTFFTGKAELSWILYEFMPISLIREQFIERIYTILENIQYKTDSINDQHASL